MTDKTKKILKYFASIVIASLFLFLALRKVDFDNLKTEFKHVKISFILVGLGLYYFSLFARSEKWKIQIENLDYNVGHYFSFIAIIYHYFFNSFTVKIGPVARCTLITRQKVSFTECLGTLVSEMIYDLLFLILFSILLIFLKISELVAIFNNFFKDFHNYFIEKTTEFIIISIIFIVVIIIIRIIIRFYLRQTKFYIYIKKQIKLFAEAIKDSFKLKKFGLFVVWNIVLWLLLFLMNFFLLKAINITAINFTLVLAVTVFTYYGWLLPTPGGIGSVEYFLLQAFVIFAIDTHKAVAFGIIANSVTFFGIIILGLIVTVFAKKTFGGITPK